MKLLEIYLPNQLCFFLRLSINKFFCLQPKPLKTTCTIKAPSSLKKKNDQTNSKIKNETEKELIKSQEVEIR